MTSLEKIRMKFAGTGQDICLFCPAIYEHKAKLIGRGISEVAQDPDLLTESVFAEYETYKPDMLTVGMDIYNIEAQAIGAEVVYTDAKDAVPSIKEGLIENLDQVSSLQKIDTASAGRMPVVLQAAQAVHKKLGDEICVRGAVSGPLSIAAELFGIEKLIMEMVMNPAGFEQLLDYCADVTLRYGQEFIKRGMSVCLFDSQASPPLIAPANYSESMLGRMKEMDSQYKQSGCEFTEYVIGGTTDEIATMMIETGFDMILSDFCADPARMLGKTRAGQLIRRNINPRLIEQGDSFELEKEIRQTVVIAKQHSNVVLGTGVLGYNTPPENILRTKQKCEAFYHEA